MKFLHLFKSSIADFAKIEAYDDLKMIIRRALDAEDNYNLLFIGPPSSAKTLFLMGILESRKDVVYFDGSNTTNRILDVLEEKRPKIILLDEIDKMGRIFQNQLLGFMESGRIDVEQQKKQYHAAKCLKCRILQRHKRYATLCWAQRWSLMFLDRLHFTKKTYYKAPLSYTYDMMQSINKDGYCNSGLTQAGYERLHYLMRRKIPKPELCEFCFKSPPLDIANIDDIYDEGKIHWCWLCRSCHQKYDFRNGVRIFTEEHRNRMSQSRLGDKNPMWGMHPSIESRRKLSEALTGRKLSYEHKQNIRVSKLGSNNPMFGKDLSGSKNPMWGKHRSAKTNLRMKLARSNAKAFRSMFLSGKFTIISIGDITF